MKKIKISKDTTREMNSVRTARRLYTLQIPGQNIIFSFKNKKKHDAFITDLHNEIDLFILIINQIIADLYTIYRQNWQIYRGSDIAFRFLNIDKLLHGLIFGQRDVYYIVTNIIMLVNNIYSITAALNKMAKDNKNYSLNHFIKAFEYRIGSLTDNIFNFGKTGKWAAYSQVYDTKKLY